MNDGPPQSMTGPFTLIPGQTLRYWSVDALLNAEAPKTYTHRPDLEDPFLEAIPSPRTMPMIRLTGRSTKRSLELELADPQGEVNRLAIPIGPKGSFSHHVMLKGEPGGYLLKVEGILPMEVGLELADLRLDPRWPLTVADLDGDQDQELLAVSRDGWLHAWHDDGQAVQGWPVRIDDTQGGPPPAVADLDGDGTREVVSYAPNELAVWNSNGTPRWKKFSTMLAEMPTPVIVRLGAGEPVAYGVVSGIDIGFLSTWDANGQLLSGWPVGLGSNGVRWLAVADLDGDGREEIIGTSNRGVAAFTLEGKAVSGWPVSACDLVTAGPVVIGERSGSRQEASIFVGCENGSVVGWTAHGQPLPGWPVSADGSLVELALGDLDRDGEIEVVGVTTSRSLFAWKGDGSKLPGWPVPLSPDHSSGLGLRIISLANPDGVLVATAHDGRWVAFNGAGQTVQELIGAETWAVNNATGLTDLDQDGEIEWFSWASRGGAVHLHVLGDSRVRGEDEGQWPQFAHDARHTSHVEMAARFIRGDANGDGEVDISDVVRILLHLFQGGIRLEVPDAADVNDDGEINITDSIYLLQFLFKGGPPPPAPFLDPGVDPTPDPLKPDGI